MFRAGLSRIALALPAGASIAYAQSNYATPYFFTTLAGVNTSGAADGTGNAARFFMPKGVAVDLDGNVYVGDTNNHVIRKISFYGVVTTLAGTAGIPGATNGTGSAARFNLPRGVAVDKDGNVYVADSSNYMIRKITPAGVVTTLAGGIAGSLDGAGTAARFLSPYGIAVDTNGNVYVADVGNHAIRKITPTGVVTTLAGVLQSAGSTDGTGAGAKFSSPFGVAVDPSGNVYVADRDNHEIRKITPTGVVTTMAGLSNNISADTDGTGTAARFATVEAVAADENGNVYVADSTNSTIRKVTAVGVVTTLAGLTRSVGAADGTGNVARFNSPQGIAVDSHGNLYVADTINHTIRVSVFPPQLYTESGPQVTSSGGTANPRASFFSNVPMTAQWQKNGIAYLGSAGFEHLSKPYVDAFYTGLGLFNVQTGDLGVYSVVATNMAGSTTVAITVSFMPPPTFSTQPASLGVVAGGSATFKSSASPLLVTYQWQKDGVAIPGATSSDLTISNVQAANLGNYTVVATNSFGSTMSSVAVLGFPSPPHFDIEPPATQTITVGAPYFDWTWRWVSNVPASATLKKDGVDVVLLNQAGIKNGGVPMLGGNGVAYYVVNVDPSDVGTYTLTISNSAGSATSSTTLTLAPLNPGRLSNLSILTALASSSDSFTMGYVVGGAGTSGTKPMVIRVAGPSLTQLGVTGVLDDPKLELFAGTAKTGENDNWGGTVALTNAMANVGAFAFSSATSRDAAAAVSINSGDNSVRVSGVGAGSGTVIAELYDATPSASYSLSTPRLVNVSVLKNLGSSLTVGFVIGGTTSKTVLIRAIGPTLGAAPFNVPGTVADPQLTVFSGSTKIGENNDWGGTAALTAAFGQVGAFALPAASKDAVVLATLAPGSYTVQVSGTGTTTGIALVEVYEVP